jgi:hypothetical protein
VYKKMIIGMFVMLLCIMKSSAAVYSDEVHIPYRAGYVPFNPSFAKNYGKRYQPAMFWWVPTFDDTYWDEQTWRPAPAEGRAHSLDIMRLSYGTPADSKAVTCGLNDEYLFQKNRLIAMFFIWGC